MTCPALIPTPPTAEVIAWPLGRATFCKDTLPTEEVRLNPVMVGFRPMVVDPRLEVRDSPDTATTAFCWPCAEKGASAKVVIPNAIN